MNCLFVDEDAPAVPTGKCCMSWDTSVEVCGKDCFDYNLICNECKEENTKHAVEYQKQKEQYKTYKQSQIGVIGFGKYKDKTVDWLLKHDMKYAEWILTKRKFEYIPKGYTHRNQMERVAEEIYHKLNTDHPITADLLNSWR